MTELEFEDGMNCCIGCTVVAAGVGLGMSSNEISAGVGAAADAADPLMLPTPAFVSKKVPLKEERERGRG